MLYLKLMWHLPWLNHANLNPDTLAISLPTWPTSWPCNDCVKHPKRCLSYIFCVEHIGQRTTSFYEDLSYRGKSDALMGVRASSFFRQWSATRGEYRSVRLRTYILDRILP
jgi:hypothetical protein